MTDQVAVIEVTKTLSGEAFAPLAAGITQKWPSLAGTRTLSDVISREDGTEESIRYEEANLRLERYPDKIVATIPAGYADVSQVRSYISTFVPPPAPAPVDPFAGIKEAKTLEDLKAAILQVLQR